MEGGRKGGMQAGRDTVGQKNEKGKVDSCSSNMYLTDIPINNYMTQDFRLQTTQTTVMLNYMNCQKITFTHFLTSN